MKPDKDGVPEEFKYYEQGKTNMDINMSLCRPSIQSRSRGRKSISNIFYNLEEFFNEREKDADKFEMMKNKDYIELLQEKTEAFPYDKMMRFAKLIHPSLEGKKANSHILDQYIKQYGEYMLYVGKEIRSVCTDADELMQSQNLNIEQKQKFEELKERCKQFMILYVQFKSDKNTNLI